MTERWKRVGEVFDRAAALPAAERETFLAEACAGDPELAAEVRSLLAHHEQASDFLSEPPAALLEPLPEPALALAPGVRFGAWRVERLLGEGGMGAVYLVERTEGGFRQQGALKRMRHGALSAELVRRFVRERQILASLDHPYIARLLDGGTTEDGEPWLVMQYVDGRPLYEHCSDGPLSVAGRLRLFLDICAAVQYAHERLVLHRDLKPGNLLIAADGSPRLLDFGIAKIFAEEGGDALDASTAQAPLTPEYASPEQLRGEPVGVTSDVYTLGVLLYELLTGVRPYPPTRGVAPPALERDPERPSTAAARAVTEHAEESTTGGRRRLPAPPLAERDALRRALTGDLDNIVLRAMHREPARRYATVEQLAADVRRHLDGFPVLARPDAWGYRAGKYLRRNRLAVSAAAAVTLALIGGLGASLWQARIARTERARAERRLHDVHGLARAMLFDVQDAIADLPGASQARVLLVRNAAEYLRRLAAESERDTSIQRDLAEAYERLGTLQGRHFEQGVGEEDAALGSFREAVRLRSEVAAMRPGDLETQRTYAAALHSLAAFMLEHQMSNEALAVQGRSIEVQQRIVTLQPADTLLALNAMIMRNNYARALVHTGRFAEGLPMSRRTLVEFPPHVAARPADQRMPPLLAQFHLEYGYLLAIASTDPDTARSHLLIALEILDRALHDRPGAVPLRMNVAAATGTLSMVEMFGLQRTDSAMRYVALSRATVEAVVHDDPGNVACENQLAVARMQEAGFAARIGDFARAERLKGLCAPVAARWGRDSTMRDWSKTQANSARVITALASEARAKHAAGAQAAQAWSETRRQLEGCLADMGPEKPEAYEDCYLPEQRADLVRRIANARLRAGD